MDPTVEIALIGGFTAVCTIAAPLFLSALTARNARIEKAESYKREDEVARKAEEAAQRLIERQDKLADLAREASQRAEESSKEAAKLSLAVSQKVDNSSLETNSKLDVIHTLVNSQLTAAMQAELDATRREVVSLKEISEIKAASGLPPSPDSMQVYDETQRKIVELQTRLDERLKAAKLVELQQAAAKAKDELRTAVISSGVAQEPVPVADEAAKRTATATERMADASEKRADATVRIADASEGKGETK